MTRAAARVIINWNAMKFLTDAQIGFAVKTARLAAGWSGKMLSEHSGVSSTALSKIEGGKQSLSFSEGTAIAKVLGIRPDHLERLALDAEEIADRAASAKENLKRELQDLERKMILRAIKENPTNSDKKE